MNEEKLIEFLKGNLKIEISEDTCKDKYGDTYDERLVFSLYIKKGTEKIFIDEDFIRLKDIKEISSRDDL